MNLPQLLGTPFSWLYRLWCMSLRREELGRDVLSTFVDNGQPVVAAVWHDELFPFMSFRRDWPVVAVVSRSRDGEWLSSILHGLGVSTVRGSSSKGGANALHGAARSAQRGNNVVITLDGPRGPRHKAKPGALHLAAREGMPVVPARLFMENSKKFGSWDRFQLPMPFSRVRLVWGEPYTVTGDLSQEADLAAACEDLERRLQALELHQ